MFSQFLPELEVKHCEGVHGGHQGEGLDEFDLFSPQHRFKGSEGKRDRGETHPNSGCISTSTQFTKHPLGLCNANRDRE